MPIEEDELESEEEQKDEEEIGMPKISEIIGDPIKIVTYVYDTFKSQKKKEELKILRDIAISRQNWNQLSNDPAYKSLMSVKMANALIESIDRAYWIANFRAEKADRAMEEIKSLLPEYYIMKKDEELGLTSEETKSKETILKIEKKDEDLGKEFIENAKKLVPNYMEDEIEKIVFQSTVAIILKKERYDKNFIAGILGRAPGYLKGLKLPEELNTKILNLFSKIYELYNFMYGFYPFRWGEYNIYKSKQEENLDA